MSGQTLDAFFRPRNVAVIGATERPGTVGRAILWNLMSSPFGGAVLPINPKRSSVLGIKAYPTIQEANGPVDLAVIATPAETVPGVISECVDAGVKAAIVVSAGFREVGAAGLALEKRVLAEARRGKMRIIGPNCLGLMCPTTGLNATFANTMARPGNVGFISQSGALCTAILDWSFAENVGFSAFVRFASDQRTVRSPLWVFPHQPGCQWVILHTGKRLPSSSCTLSSGHTHCLASWVILPKLGG